MSFCTNGRLQKAHRDGDAPFDRAPRLGELLLLEPESRLGVWNGMLGLRCKRSSPTGRGKTPSRPRRSSARAAPSRTPSSGHFTLALVESLVLKQDFCILLLPSVTLSYNISRSESICVEAFLTNHSLKEWATPTPLDEVWDFQAGSRPPNSGSLQCEQARAC